MNLRAWAALVIGALLLSFAAGIIVLGVNYVLTAAPPTYESPGHDMMPGLMVSLLGFGILAIGVFVVALGIPADRPPPFPPPPAWRPPGV